jgi:hypothetical protein
MVPKRLPLGAGRNPTGTTPPRIQTIHPQSYVRNPRKSHIAPKSNRHLVKLKCDVTPTKQTQIKFLIGHRCTNFPIPLRTSNRHTTHRSEIACRAGWALPIRTTTTHSAPTPRLAWDSRPGCPLLRTQRALDCGPLATALPAAALPPNVHAPSGQPTPPATASVAAGQRSVLTGQPLYFSLAHNPPVATHLIISNRSARRLETLVTLFALNKCSRSNRHKFRHQKHHLPRTCPLRPAFA